MYSNKWNVLAITIALVCLLSGAAAQDEAPTVLQPLNCSAAEGLVLNDTNLLGVWYEVARNPANPNVGCVQINSTLSADNTTLDLRVTFSNTPGAWWQNRSESGSVTLIPSNTAGYNVTFTLDNQTQTPSFFKLLATYNENSVTYIAGCGRTNSSDDSTVFAYLLSNSLFVNQTGLNFINSLAALNYSDFSNSSNITAVNQLGCIRSSAGTHVPILAAFFAAFFVLLKALHLA